MTQELWPGGPLFRDAAPFRLSTDSVLLADFTRPRGGAEGIDLGCGSGVLSLLLALKDEKLHMTGLELLPEAAAAARENAELNGLDGRIAVVEGDIRAHRALFRAGSFDLAVSNPPYFPERAGAVSPEEGRAAARSECGCSLTELCEAAAFLLRTGGSFFLVHRPERLSELCGQLSAHGLEPKRLRLVCHRADSAPSLVLLEARRGGKPDLKIEPMLVLCGQDGGESEEYRRIYHR